MADDKGWKRVVRVNALRDRIGEWAAQHWPTELQDGILCWLGQLERSELLVLQGIAFSLIATPEDGVPLFERYVEANGKQPRLDRAVLDGWRATEFAICEVMVVERVVGFLLLQDGVTGMELGVIESAASAQLKVGDWIACFLMPTESGVEIEGTPMPLAGGARIAAVQALIQGMEERGIESGRAEPGVSRGLARAVVRAGREAQRTPRVLNYDRHPIELITATLDVAWADVVKAAESWEDAAVEGNSVTLLGRNEPALSGPIVLATFYSEDGSVDLTANSRERLEQVLALWETRVGSPLGVANEAVHAVDSDPEGPELLMDSGYTPASAERGEADVLKELMSNWLETGIPALGALTPREAVEAGRLAEVRALLPTQLGKGVVDALRVELGL